MKSYTSEAPSLAGRLGEIKAKGKLKSKLQIHAHMEAAIPGLDASSGSWRKEEMARLKSEMSGIEKELANWDDAKAGQKARKSLQADHAVKKARIAMHQAEMKRGGGGMY